MPLRVLLADDHGLVRKSFRRLLEDDPQIHVAGEAADGAEAVRMALEIRPHVIIMDLLMPRLSGLQASREILRARPDTAILILSMYPDAHYVRDALSAGACGYILKSALDIDLAAAVKSAAVGQNAAPAGLLPQRLEQDDVERLTPREKQILEFIARGKSNREIAALLGLSVHTVNVHRAHIMSALRVHRTADLVVYALHKGLVHLP